MQPRSQKFAIAGEAGLDLHCLCWKSAESSDLESLPPIILLHGGGANAHWWDHLAPRLARQQPVYALDFRGHGESSYPAERRVGAFGDDLEALIDWLGRADVQLVGHSLGAAVALDHASRFGETRRLALIDLARGGQRGSGRRARLALSLRRTYRTREDAIERFRFLPESSHPPEDLRLHIARHSVQEEPDGRFGYRFDPAWFSLPTKPRPDLTEVRCPTLLVRGAESTILSADAAREFVGQLIDGRLIEIAQAGHHVLLDRPDALYTALASFLEMHHE